MTDNTIVEGASLEIFRQKTGTSLLPQLREDMTPEVRQETVREIITKTSSVQGMANFILAESIYEVYSKEYWKDWVSSDGEVYKSFEDYAQDEAGLERRKAYYFKQLYEKYCIELDLGVDSEYLKHLEWSKASALVTVINLGNYQELLNKIKGMSLTEIKNMVREMKIKDLEPEEGEEKPTITPEKREDFVKMKFNMSDSQAETVEMALEIAENLSGSNKEGNLLSLICSDFAACSPVTPSMARDKLAAMLQNIEENFHVKLQVELDPEYYDVGAVEEFNAIK